jgi:hypothetical protein
MKPGQKMPKKWANLSVDASSRQAGKGSALGGNGGNDIIVI